MKFLKYFNSSKQNFLIWTFAFLFASVAFILSFLFINKNKRDNINVGFKLIKSEV